jgi:hypothetical protein
MPNSQSNKVKDSLGDFGLKASQKQTEKNQIEKGKKS